MELPFAFPPTVRRSSLLPAIVLVVLSAAALLGFLTLVERIQVGPGTEAYGLDFRADYVAARGWWDGLDIYRLDVDDLSTRYLGARNQPYPNPHLPSAVALLLPMARLDVALAQTLWLAAELLSLLVAVGVGLRVLDVARPRLAGALLTLGLLIWQPVSHELSLGQAQLPILAALVCAYAALLRRRDLLAGALLGATLLLKPIVWPLLLVLAIRQRWRVPLAAGAVAVVGNGAAVAVLGLPHLVDWLTVALPTATAVTDAEPWNMSVWTLGRRLFVGTGPGAADYLAAPPLVEAPNLARPLSLLAVAAVLLVALRAGRPGRPLGIAYGVGVCAAIALSPMLWGQYLVLALVPVGLLLDEIAQRGWPATLTLRAVVAFTPLAEPLLAGEALARSIAGVEPLPAAATIPFWLMPLTVLPVLGLVLLAVVLAALPPPLVIAKQRPNHGRGEPIGGAPESHTLARAR